MTKAEIKKYLSRYRAEMARAQRLKVDQLRFSCSSDLLQKQIDEATRNAEGIESAICAEQDLMNREILMRKYIYGDTLEEIACQLNYSVRHVQRLLDHAVDSLILPPS